MNDRLTADLRQHLLDTTDARPVEGQFAAVVEHVAVTAQRHPLAARLTASPDRAIAFPAGAMRYALVAVGLVATLGAGTLLAGGASGGRTDFEGTWTSADPVDGSMQYLAVASGSAPAVQFADSYATGPACVADTVKVFTADGTGTIDGDRLEVRWPNDGGCGLMTAGISVHTFTYDDATDSLVDDNRLTWERAAAGVVLPTRGPLPASPVPDVQSASPPDSECLEFRADTTDRNYHGVVGPYKLRVTVPTTPDKTWHGLRGGFVLYRANCSFGGPWVDASVIERVYGDACDRAGTSLEVDSPAATIAALAAQQGVDIVGPTAITVDGHAAARFEVTVATGVDRTTCTDGVLQIFDGVANDLPATVVLVDVDGATLGVVFHGFEDEDPAIDRVLAADVDEIVASLRIDRWF